MRVATLDEDKGTGAERKPLAVDGGRSRPRQDVEPLIGAAVPVDWSALGIAGTEDHLRRLGALVASCDAETVAEPEVLSFYRPLLAVRERRTAHAARYTTDG